MTPKSSIFFIFKNSQYFRRSTEVLLGQYLSTPAEVLEVLCG